MSPKPTAEPTPSPAASPAPAPTAAVASDLIAPTEPELTAGGKAPTKAADAAALLTDPGPTGGEGPGAESVTPPKIGRASERAKAGFNRHLTKPQLIQRGREIAERNARLEAELAALKGEPAPDGMEGQPGAVVTIDPKQLEQPLAEMAGVLSDFLSAWRGDHWAFTAEEREKLGHAGAPVLAELAPALGAHANKITLVLVVLGIAMPRLRKDRELAAGNPAGAK